MSPPQPQTVQQGIAQQMQQQAGQPANTGNTSGTAPATPETPAATAPTNPAVIAQQAAAAADNQLASMVQSGILVSQGNDYIIEMTLNQGQLTVNGKPFNPAMLKLQ